LPPAAMRPNPAPDSPGELVQLNVRVDRKLADWLADRALAEGACRRFGSAGLLRKLGHQSRLRIFEIVWFAPAGEPHIADSN